MLGRRNLKKHGVCLFRVAIDETANRRDTTVIDQAVIARAATAERTST